MAFKFKPADYTALYESGVLTIRLHGEIDHHSAKGIREQIDRELFYYRAATVILDMAEVSFMDSAGLGLILGRYTKAAELGGMLRLLDPSPDVVRLLELAGCTALIPIEYSGQNIGRQQPVRRATTRERRKLL